MRPSRTSDSRVEPGDLAADRVEAGQKDSFRSVVDDEVDASRRLERSDVSALAADDPALHVVARQVQHRDHGLGRLLARQSLDGKRDDLASSLLALLVRLSLDVADQDRSFPLRLILDARDQLSLGLPRRQPRGALKDEASLLLNVFQLGALAVDSCLDFEQLAVALLDPALLAVEALLALGQPVLASLEIEAQLTHVVLECPDLVLGLLAGALGGNRRRLCLLRDVGGLNGRAFPDVVRFAPGGLELILDEPRRVRRHGRRPGTAQYRHEGEHDPGENEDEETEDH